MESVMQTEEGFDYVKGTPYFYQADQMKTYPKLTEDLTTEVIIVGGGITGAITAYYFAKQKIPCVLLEKNKIAQGSTSITTALLQYELDENAVELQPFLTEEQVVHAYKLGVWALQELDEFIQLYGNACEYERKDTLLYTNQEDQVSELRKEYELRKKHELDVTFVTEDASYPFPMKAGVLSKAGGASMNPVCFTKHLLEVTEAFGAKIYEETEVIEVQYEHQGVTVRTKAGNTIQGKKIIVATGYHTAQFTDRVFGEKTITYNIVTEPNTSPASKLDALLIRDNCDPYHYLRTTQDGRFILGGADIPLCEENYTEEQAEIQYQKLEEQVAQMFRKSEAMHFPYRYCGMFCATQDNLGFVGPDPMEPHCWYCLGYGANGILFAILGAISLVHLYEQGSENEILPYFSLNRK